jgi:type IV pilus assembly protein PilC
MATAQVWAYVGRDSTGKTVKGKLDALSETAVVSRLGALGISPVSIKETGEGTGLNREFSIPGFTKGVGLKDLAIMSRQMATMIGSGLSLLRTLNILAEQTESKPLAKILTQVRDDVETGISISAAFGKHSREFPPIMINMVRAGETGGFLDRALESIAANFEKEVKLRGTIKSAMTYPVIVLIMSLASVMIMLIFIVPIFEDMFKGLGSGLPIPTMILVNLSHSMVFVGPVLVVVIVAFSIWWNKNKHTDRVRKAVDPVKLKLPVFGSLLKRSRSPASAGTSPT